MASIDLGTLKIAITANNKKANEALDETKEKVKSTSGFISKFGNAAWKGMKVAGAGIAAVATATVTAVGSMIAAAKSTAEAADEIDKTSLRMGVSAEEYQRLAYVAQQTGVEMTALEDAAKELSKTGTDMDLSQAIAEIAAVEDANERARLATEMFGEEAAWKLAPMLGIGTEAITAIKDEADALGIVMSEDAVAAGVAFNDAMNRFSSTMTAVKNNIVASFLPSLTQIMDGLTGLVIGTEGAKEQFAAGVNGFVSTLSEAAPQVLEGASLIITTLLGAITESLPSLFESGTDIVLNLLQGLITMLPDILNAGMSCLTSLLQGIIDALPQLVPTVVTVVTQLVTNLTAQLPTIIGMGIQLLTSLIQGIIESLPTLVAAMPQIIESIINTLTSNIPLIIQCGVDLLTSLITNLPAIIVAIVKAVPQIVIGIINGFKSLFTSVVSCGEDLFNNIKTAIGNVLPSIIETAKGVVTSIIDGIKSFFSNMLTLGGDLFTKVKEGIGGKLSDIVDAAKGVVTGAIDGIKNLGSSFITAGGDIVSGLITGIGNGASAICDKVKSICKSALDTVKSWFGIKSPSKVMKEMGLFIDKGLELGIEGGAKDVIKSVKALSDDTQKAFNPSLSAGVNFAAKLSAGSAANGNKAGSGNNITQNNYFTQRELTPYETIQQQRKLNKQLVGVFA